MSEASRLYEDVQIVLAGIRLFRHFEKRIPSLKELADFIRYSLESVHHLCNRLEKLGAIERIQGAFEDRVCLKDPSKAEVLRVEAEKPDLEEDVKKWKEQRDGKIREIEERFTGDADKHEKEGLFSKIEEKIRKGGHEEKKSPLDDLFSSDLGKKE